MLNAKSRTKRVVMRRIRRGGKAKGADDNDPVKKCYVGNKDRLFGPRISGNVWNARRRNECWPYVRERMHAKIVGE